MSEPLHVLLIEDNLDDIDLFRLALEKTNTCIRLSVAHNGEEALNQLRASSSPLKLIMLDLNMPRKDGRELLAEIKGDPGLQQIPVVVLSTSDSEKDILQSYRLGAACYLVKPVNFDEFQHLIRKLFEFWQKVEMLPQKEGPKAG